MKSATMTWKKEKYEFFEEKLVEVEGKISHMYGLNDRGVFTV
jgi:hypothetical protein